MRTKRLEVRLSEEELAKLKARAAAQRMRAGSFMRTAALDRLPPTIPQINQTALAELHRVGANLNQIAHRMNATGEAPDLLELHQQVSALRLALQEARQ